jgi:hypothetical protein
MLQETVSSRMVIVHIERSFAPEDAARIHDLLLELEPGVKLEIDFGRARDCADVALALLAHDIVGLDDRVELRGTSHHQRRLLAYFGVPAAQAVAAAGAS